MAACATPWRHPTQDEREAVLSVSVDGTDPVDLCLDCAAVTSRQAIANTREAQITGSPGATATIRVGPVRS